MSNSVIKVQNLSKRYRLGLKEKQANTLVGQISQILRSPFENLNRLRDLNRFGNEDESVFWALKDVSFEVKEGEVLGIIGKNGAGKSTLLKILSQITEPTSGKIEIHGRVASLLEVGTGFHPELSGRENIYMNGTILGMTRREIHSKLDEIIDFSGVEKFIDTPVKFYSSGMKVRLGFSVAAHLEPEILIIDEVLAVGDYEFQKKCLGKMEDVSKNQGRTVLFVSHNLGAIQNLTNYSILLKNGMIDLNNTTKKVIEYYFKSEPKENDFSFPKGSFFSKITPKYTDGNTAFCLDEEIKFQIELNRNVKIPNRFRVGFTISSFGDVNLVSGISNEINISIGENLIGLTIKNPGLVDGDYKLSLSVGLGNLYNARREFEVYRDVLCFSIVNSKSKSMPLFNWYDSYGYMVKDEKEVNLYINDFI